MKNNIRPFLFLSLVSLLTVYACKKVINVDLKNATPQIVIEGNVVDTVGNTQVTITKTVDFSASNVYPPVTNAVVTITDSTTGQVFPLSQTDSGVYITNAIRGQVGHTYLLSVTISGTVYTASSTMPVLVPLDSVTFELDEGANGKNDIDAVVHFQDPPGIANYYQFTEFRNGKMIPNTFVLDDRLSDGKYINWTLYNDSSYLQQGDSLYLTMYCIDKNIYNYFYEFVNVTSNSNGDNATPANPDTNISGGVLGYFSAHTFRATRLKIGN